MTKMGALDRPFYFLERRKKLTLSIAAFALALLWWFRVDLTAAINPHRDFFNIINLVLGPIATTIGFYFGFRSKREMVEHSKASQVHLTDQMERAQILLNEKQAEFRNDAVARAEELGSLRMEVSQREREVSVSAMQVKEAQEELERRSKRIADLESDMHRITEGANELWRLKPAKPFPTYREWLNEPKGARVVTVANLKGGVGKTTLAANLAAYISEVRKLPVLLIDVDYQGSLSNMSLLPIERMDIGSNVDALFAHNSSLATLIANEIHLAPKLTRGWIVPASYSLAQVENRLLLRWLTDQETSLDVRYRLAHLLLNPDVRRKYAAIIIDSPPRMAIGSINAFVASHYLVAPSGFDRLSGEALSQFLSQMRALREEMGLGIDLAGVVGMMSRQASLGESEAGVWADTEVAAHAWQPEIDFRFPATVPKRAAISSAAGEDFAILLPGQPGNDVREFFHPLCKDICDRIRLDGWR